MFDQDSIQLAILKALTTHLQGINATNGYVFDMSMSVYRGKLLFGDETPVPFLSIVEHLSGDIQLDTAGEENQMSTQTWVLLVQGCTKNDAKRPTDETYLLKAATEHRLSRLIDIDPSNGDPKYPDEYYLGFYGKGITRITIGPGVVSPPRQGISDKAFFYLPLGVGLAIDITQPYVT